MKDLDIRTMMVMISALSLLLAGLLALAGLHAGNIRGMRQWALANVCISISLGFAYTQVGPSTGIIIVCGGLFMAIGMCLQFYGIKLFKEEVCSQFVVLGLLLLPLLVLVQNSWFVLISPDVHARVIANSIVYALINAACARALLVRIESPLRTAYWFTGAAFSVQALVFAVRAVVVLMAPPDSYGLYMPTTINPVTFFVGSIVQLCLTFGFVLMLNYRLATNLQKLASSDALTGVMNRRSLDVEATRVIARHVNTGEVMTVMLLDVNHFKNVNDTYGHAVGDRVLQTLASVIGGLIRDGDYFARYGGEEFCLVMPEMTEALALPIAERLREACAAISINTGEKPLSITISIGIADSSSSADSFSALVAAADQAMYHAKRSGRNRVVSYSAMKAA